jgi:hypothetical protein
MFIHGYGFCADEQMSGQIVVALDETSWEAVQQELALLKRAAQALEEQGQGLEVILKSPRKIEASVYSAAEIEGLGDLDDLEDLPLEELLDRLSGIEAQEALVGVVLYKREASLEGHILEPSYSGSRETRPLRAVLL